jgi:hypothetical protein
MATSGSADFNRTRDEIIKAAYRKIGVIRATQTPNAKLIEDGAEALNGLVKHWQGRGIHIWTVTEATLFPQPGQIQYSLSSSSTDNATQSFVATTVAMAAASGASTVTVADDTGISSADYIGVVVDDGTVHWTTVNGAPAADVITLTTALDDSAAEGNIVYAYTTKIVRPLKVVDARWVDAVSLNETPVVTMMARLDYRRLPNKTQAGSVTQAFYDPQLTTGYLNLWQVPSVFEGYVNFTWHRPIQDFDAAGDNPDLPQEWIRTLTWNLAQELGPEFDVPAQKWSMVQQMAAESLEDMEGWDREEEPICFGPDMGYGY